jgi:hypothetical protein
MFFLKSTYNVKNPKNKKEVIRNRHFSFLKELTGFVLSKF